MNVKPSKRALIAKLILCCLFVVLLISFVRTNELAAVFSRLDWRYLTLSLLLGPLMLLVSCLKWKVLLDLGGKKLGLTELVRIYLMGYFFSNLLPSTVGGDVVRSYYSGRLLGNQAFAAVCVFGERFSGLLLLFALVILAPLARPGLYASPYIYVPAGAAFLLLCLVIVIWQWREPLGGPGRKLTAFGKRLRAAGHRSNSPLVRRAAEKSEQLGDGLRKRLARVHDELGGALRLVMGNGRIAGAIVLLTVLYYGLTWVNVYVSFRAFGVDPGFLAVVALVPTIMFVAHLPLTFLGNLGFFESVFVMYFLQAQVLPAETLAMGLLLRVKLLLLGLAGLFVYLVYKRDGKIRLQELRGGTGR
ncbi:MAG: lysylphosphatidylglycerol synthase transmembrane domain-containing protein [Thermodesulfobacteriota bacterium]